MKKLMIVGGLVALGVVYLKDKVKFEVVEEDFEDGRQVYQDLHDAIGRVEDFENRRKA